MRALPSALASRAETRQARVARVRRRRKLAPAATLITHPNQRGTPSAGVSLRKILLLQMQKYYYLRIIIRFLHYASFWFYVTYFNALINKSIKICT